MENFTCLKLIFNQMKMQVIFEAIQQELELKELTQEHSMGLRQRMNQCKTHK
jgi:predicted GIY-YIG superfamily endonuclease